MNKQERRLTGRTVIKNEQVLDVRHIKQENDCYVLSGDGKEIRMPVEVAVELTTDWEERQICSVVDHHGDRYCLERGWEYIP